jgi:ribosomal protein L4
LAHQLAKNKRRIAISRILFLGFHLEGFRFEILKEAKLKEAKLKEAKLKEAKLKEAKLKEAKLKEAKLKEDNIYIKKRTRRIDGRVGGLVSALSVVAVFELLVLNPLLFSYSSKTQNLPKKSRSPKSGPNWKRMIRFQKVFMFEWT